MLSKKHSCVLRNQSAVLNFIMRCCSYLGFIFLGFILFFGNCTSTIDENNEPSTVSSTATSSTTSTLTETTNSTNPFEPENTTTANSTEAPKKIVVHGVRVIKRSERDPYVLRISGTKFHLIGTFLNNIKEAWLSTLGHCTEKDTTKINVALEEQVVTAGEDDSFTRNALVSIPDAEDSESTQIYHFCGKANYGLFKPCEEYASWRPFIKLAKEEDSSKIFLPLYIQIPVIVFLAFLSALFSGLNVGLMSLSVSSLELIIKHDQAKKQYAQNILPLRKNGNLLLCTILIGNTFVNNAMTLLVSNLLDEVMMDFELWLNFMFSVVLPAAIIVFIGEIIPQAICCRYGLIIGSRTRYITIFFIVLTFVISYPLSKILDWLIGVEGPESYDNATLEHIIDMNVEQLGGFTRHLADIARRALQFFNGKQAYDVMTPIERVYMLSETAVINDELVKKICENGYTRIPIHKDGDNNNIIGILNVKDLVPIDRKCNLTIGTIIQIWQRSKHFRFVNEDFYISQLLKEMKRGQSMALVIRFNEETKNYKVIGIIALEDIIEELTGEILDEKDVKRLKKLRNLR